jgi:hypothetical protein
VATFRTTFWLVSGRERPMLRRILPALGAVVLLAACSSDPEPQIAAPTPSPSASASASASPAVESSAAVAETPEEFIKRWLQTDVDMQNSGDTAAYRALTPDCVDCQQFADQVERYYAAGGYIRFGGQEMLSSTRLGSNGPRSVYEVVVDPEPTEYATAAGKPSKTLAGEKLTYKVTLAEADQSWLLAEATQLAQ